MSTLPALSDQSYVPQGQADSAPAAVQQDQQLAGQQQAAAAPPASPEKPSLWKSVLSGAMAGLAGSQGSTSFGGGLAGGAAGQMKAAAAQKEQALQQQEAQSNIKFRDAQAAHFAAADTNALKQLELQTQESKDRHDQMSQAGLDWAVQHGATVTAVSDNTHEGITATAEGLSKDQGGVPALQNYSIKGKIYHVDLSTFSSTPQGLESVNQFLQMTNQKPLTPQQWQTMPDGVRNQRVKSAMEFATPTDAFSSAAAASGSYQQSKAYLDALNKNPNADPGAATALTQRTALLKQQADGMAKDEAAKVKRESAARAGSSEAVEAQAQDLVAGTLAPSQLSKRAGSYGAVLARADAIAKGQGLPGFNAMQAEMNFKSGQALQKEFTSGAAAKNLTAFNTASGHLAQLDGLVSALNNNDIQLFNKLGNQFSKATGGTAPSNFDAVKTAVAGEVSKTFTGNIATDTEIKHVTDVLSSSQSPAQLKGAIAEVRGLLASKKHALQQQYEAGKQGRPAFGDSGGEQPVKYASSPGKPRLKSTDGGKTWQPAE